MVDLAVTIVHDFGSWQVGSIEQPAPKKRKTDRKKVCYVLVCTIFLVIYYVLPSHILNCRLT